MELYAQYHNSPYNCSTFIYVGTKDEVDAEWSRWEKRRKKLEEHGFRGCNVTPMHTVYFRKFEYGKDIKGYGFMHTESKFSYNYYLVI